MEKPASPFIPIVVATALDEKGNGDSYRVRPPSAVPDRFIAYVFDDIHLKGRFGDGACRRRSPSGRKSLGPGSRAAIFTTSGQVVLDFTDDRDKLHETLGRIQPQATLREATDCLDINYYWSDAIINKNDDQATAAATAEVMACRGYTAQQQDLAAAEAHATAMSVLSRGERESRLDLSVLKDVIRAFPRRRKPQ